MIDETYVMPDALPANGNHILLTTTHPDSVKTIAWVRQYRQSRVFCLQSGHDNQTWADASFQRLLRQGILWSSGE
jgi:type 1 glutamine amidotransferase